jgi:hypothetical protein
VGGVGEATNATGLPTAARRSTQRFGGHTFGISLVYSSHVTLYATSTVTTNLTEDYVPSAPLDFDCCFKNTLKINFEELPLQVPLVNVMSDMDELRIARKDKLRRWTE